jgi:hypothetical protein
MRFCLLLILAGCSNPAPPQRAPDEYDSIEGIGCGTDENWRTFDDEELGHLVKVDDPSAPLFVAPVQDGAMVPSSPKPTFAWQPTPTLTGKPGGNAACPYCPTCGPLLASHQLPVSGDVYDLQFSVGGSVVHRIIYTSQRWTPPDSLWSSWKGQKVSIAAVRMTLKVNDITDGPFQASKPTTFTVE